MKNKITQRLDNKKLLSFPKTKKRCQQSYVNTICKSIRVTILIFSDLSGGKWCPQTKYMYRKHETLYSEPKKKYVGFRFPDPT
jgi:hypothetical protein